MVIIAYIAGALTVPALFGAYFLLNWGFSKTQAYGDCLVCSHLPEHEIGEHFNISEWFRAQWHDIWWSHRAWHKKAVEEDLRK